MTDEDARLLREICRRIRAEADSIYLVSARDRMLAGKVRPQVINEVIKGMARDAAQQFQALDDETIRLAFEDLAE